MFPSDLAQSCRRLVGLCLLGAFVLNLSLAVRSQEPTSKLADRDKSKAELRDLISAPFPLPWKQHAVATGKSDQSKVDACGWLDPRRGRPEIQLGGLSAVDMQNELLKAPQLDVAFKTDLTANELNRTLKQDDKLKGLPWRNENERQLSPESAHAWLRWRISLQDTERAARKGEENARIVVLRAEIRRVLAKWASLQPEKRGINGQTVGFLVQVLQTEEANYRRALVDMLALIPGPEAGAALVQRAIFEPEPEIRAAAIGWLKQRPPQERAALLGALRYPWPTAAHHAAHALVTLNAKEDIPQLIRMLDYADPRFAERIGDSQLLVRELVRVNHFRNCLLCHASDKERKSELLARAPDPGRSFDPSFFASFPEYYSRNAQPDAILVRADVTYLRQDFSVNLWVRNASPWVDEQRYDFLIRTRPATAEEIKQSQTDPASYPQREAVLFALRGLTGRDMGNSSAAWRKYLEQRR